MEATASVVGFIGLTGQVLQGCNYLSTLFSDAKEAPEIIRAVSAEIQAIESSLLHFQALKSELDVNPHLVPHDWSPAPALTCCNEAINALKCFIQNFPELHSLRDPIAAHRIRGKWQRLNLAKNMNRLQRHLHRLQNAKSGLELLQSNIGGRTGLRSLLSINENVEKTEQSMSNLKTNASQNQETCVTMQAQLLDIKSCLSQQFEKLPNVISHKVEAEVIKALEKHFALGTKELSVQSHTRVVEEIASEKVNNRSPMEPPLESCNLLPPNDTETGTMFLSSKDINITKPLVKKGLKKQRARTNSYNILFGRIVITTIETTQDGLSVAEYGEKYESIAKQLMITVISNTLFSNKGALVAIGSTRPTDSHPLWDTRLRLFRTHDSKSESSVVKVLKRGDYLSFRNMMERREVTPFDQIGSSCSETLVKYIMDHLYYDIISIDKMDQQGAIRIIKLLADQGVDCGLGISMAQIQSGFSLKFDQALDLYYVMLTHSETNPFRAYYDLDEWTFRSFLTQDKWDISDFQEEYEAIYGRGSWQSRVIKRVPPRIWRQSQSDAWFERPGSLRRSKIYCSNEFGKKFVQEIWPKLCWNEQIPSFWQSKEECEQIFGEYFVLRIWPLLYWKQETPEFCRSKEKCEKFFGISFVKYEWPSLDWELEIPEFWHSWKACRNAFGYEFISCGTWARLLGPDCFEHVFGQGAWSDFVELYQDSGRLRLNWYDWLRKWHSTCTIRWWYLNLRLRHSRSHTLFAFGLEFLKDTSDGSLIDLLQDDGLTVTEAEELVKDGPDLYCRPPQWPRRNMRRSWDDVEEEGHSSNSLITAYGDRDSEYEDEEEEEDDKSDSSGWETAEEEPRDTSEEPLTARHYT